MAAGKYLDHTVFARARAHTLEHIEAPWRASHLHRWCGNWFWLLFLRSHEWNEKASIGYFIFESKCCLSLASLLLSMDNWVSIDRVLTFFFFSFFSNNFFFFFFGSSAIIHSNYSISARLLIYSSNDRNSNGGISVSPVFEDQKTFTISNRMTSIQWWRVSTLLAEPAYAWRVGNCH